MTAPFAPPPPPVLYVIVLVGVAFSLAAPHARRDDWLGWLATAVVFACAAGLWGLLLRSWGRALILWWRGGQGG